MRTGRASYSSSPAGTYRALERKAKQKRPKQEINQIMLIVFFIVLPVMGILAIFFQLFRILFIIAVIIALAIMWVLRCFLFPGRMILSGIYGFLSVLVLVSALNAHRKATPSAMTVNTYLTPVPTVAVTETPAFDALYNTMGTDVPPDYYVTLDNEDSLAGLNEVGISTGVDESQADSTGGTSGVYVPTVKSGSEIALENFMEKWYKQIPADMLEYAAPSWREAQEGDNAATQLYWKFKTRTLMDWRQMSAPTGTEASAARTIAIQADVMYNEEVRTYQYDAITLFENDNWYVDPDSLTSGIKVEQATPTPDPNMTPTPSPEPTPTPTPGPKTTLYYNKDGGKKYHIDPNCRSVSSKYLPLKGTFTYGELSKSPYNKLEPCERCGAPSK